jgi:hypothetical protein
LRPVKYNNGEANETASDVSRAKTVLKYVTSTLSETYIGRVQHPIESNCREVKCGTQPEKGINTAGHFVNGYSITAAAARSITLEGC